MTAIGYIPNQVARSLASNRSRLVACIVPTLVSSIFEQTIKGLADDLRTNGYSLLIGNTDYDDQRELELIKAALARRPDGLVLTGPVRSRLVRRLLEGASIPVVEVWSVSRSPLDMAVGFSNKIAARDVIRHLIKRGYRRIAYAGRQAASNDRAADRRAGYVEGLQEAGPELDPSLMIDCETTLKAGRQVIFDLQPRLGQIDAIMFSTDNLAAGAWFACQEIGMRVPADLAITGFGDTDIASAIPGGLTTINVNSYEIGRTAAQLLDSRWSGNESPARIVDLGFRLTPRGST